MANLTALSMNLFWLRRALSFSVFTALRYGSSGRRTIELAKVGIPMAGNFSG